MKKLSIRVGALVLMLVAYTAYKAPTLVDKNLMIELYGEGLCSASYVKSLNSDKTYIITAAHCAGLLATDGTIKAIHEDGTTTVHHFLRIDFKRDLMLLESDPSGPKVGLKVADKIMPNDLIYTLSHPHGKQLTYGQALLDWYYPMSLFNGLLEGYADFKGKTAPGSSGAPIMNKNGELVGILSAGTSDGKTTFFVRLEDIRAFMKAMK